MAKVVNKDQFSEEKASIEAFGTQKLSAEELVYAVLHKKDLESFSGRKFELKHNPPLFSDAAKAIPQTDEDIVNYFTMKTLENFDEQQFDIAVEK